MTGAILFNWVLVSFTQRLYFVYFRLCLSSHPVSACVMSQWGAVYVDRDSWPHLQLKALESSVVDMAGFCSSCDARVVLFLGYWLLTSSAFGGLSLARNLPTPRDLPSPPKPPTLLLLISSLPLLLFQFWPPSLPSSVSCLFPSHKLLCVGVQLNPA